MTATSVQPDSVYGNPENVVLRIGNGGAGQAGLVEALANGYIAALAVPGQQPLGIAWYKSDTTATLAYLKNGTVGVGLTYNEAAEALALEDGYATAYAYAFRDHFCIVGPSSNPAGLVKGADARTLFQKLYTAAQAGTSPPTRFLSRFDKSATNIKESELWVTVGQVPWAMPYSVWYHVFLDFPIQALETAATLGQYTLTDWGTWLSADPSVTRTLTMFRKGGNDATDVLLNPCHALASTRVSAADQAVASDFITWVASAAGQAMIAGFEKNGQALYSPAPSKDPSAA